MSLRTKFMLALLLTGLAAVAMVGSLAYIGMTKKVDSIRRERAVEHFHAAAGAYLAQYGSWQASPGKRGFDAVMLSREPAGGPSPLPDGRPRQEPGRRGEPPYRFILADENYRVLLGAGVYEHGELLPEAARKNARSVEVNGRVAAYVSPEAVLTPSKQELQYLAAMRDALWFGVSAAALLALVLGVLLSRSLGRTLGHLTKAARAMHGGPLRQRVPVEGKDEVAELAAAFNAMSEKLARTHEELSESHQTILSQPYALERSGGALWRRGVCTGLSGDRAVASGRAVR